MSTLPFSFDARDWAREFTDLARRRPGIATSEGAMLAWFAGALMSGFDEANRRKAVSSDETILQEAQRLVHGDRGADYGHPGDDYKATGEMWGAILERSGWKAGPVDARIACLMMAAMKVSREAGKHKRDNLTDLAGYAECAQMIAEREVAPTSSPKGTERCVS